MKCKPDIKILRLARTHRHDGIQLARIAWIPSIVQSKSRASRVPAICKTTCTCCRVRAAAYELITGEYRPPQASGTRPESKILFPLEIDYFKDSTVGLGERNLIEHISQAQPVRGAIVKCYCH